MPLALPAALLGTAALLGAWLAPNHYPPWTSFHGEAAAFAALFLFCVARLARPEPLVDQSAPLAFMCLLPLIGVQWWAGQIPYGGDALLSGLYVCGLALAWWLGAGALPLRDADPLRWLAVMVTVAAAASVLLATMQWLRMENAIGIFAAERGPEMRAFGNLAQPNHVASLLLMGTVFAAGLYLRGTLKAWHCIALVLWLAFGLTLTESRSGLLGAMVVGGVVLAKRREAGRLGDWRWIAGWWLLLIVLALVWQPLNDALYLQPPRETPIGGDNGRLVMWRQVLAGIEHAPWFGYGWRETILAQKAGAHFVSGWLATDYAHNVVLDLLAWVGVPLGLALAALCAWWLVRALLRVSDASQLVLFAAVVPVLVHSFFEFPFAYSYFLFPAGFMLGALHCAQRPPPEPAPNRQRRLRWGGLVLVLAWGVLAAAVAREYLRLEEDYRVMRFELRRLGHRPADYQAPQVRLLTQLEAMIKAGRMVARPGMTPDDIELLRVASNSFGWATLNLSYAVALGLNGQPLLATRELALARAVYGPETYGQMRRIFLELPQQFPQLAAIQVP